MPILISSCFFFCFFKISPVAEVQPLLARDYPTEIEKIFFFNQKKDL